MEKNYDVVIVGAGPAGGSCARELSNIGRSVLLIEKSKIIGEPNFSTAGTPNETLDVFGLPKSVTDSPWNSMLLASSNERAEFVYKKNMGYVLNYKKVKQFLAKKTLENGSDVLSGASVKDVTFSGKSCSGVTYEKDGKICKVGGKIIVDASGGRALISQKMGLMKFKRENLTVGIEYHMKNVDFERKGRLDFYIGGCAPSGYAWIFPMGGSKAKVGIGVIGNQKVSLNLLLKKFVKENHQTRDAIEIDVHGGALPCIGGIKNHVLDGLIVIGDAASQINPVAGEGVRHALYSGRFAAQTIDSALERNNFSKESLDSYNKKWSGYISDKWKISMQLQGMIKVATRSDRLCDVFVKKLSTYDPERIFDACFNYKFSGASVRLLKMMHGSI